MEASQPAKDVDVRLGVSALGLLMAPLRSGQHACALGSAWEASRLVYELADQLKRIQGSMQRSVIDALFSAKLVLYR